MLNLKSKIYGSLSILIITIIVLGFYGIYSLSKLSNDSKAIIKDNFLSIDYTFLMISELDKIDALNDSLKFHLERNENPDLVIIDSLAKHYFSFENLLKLQNNNITEIGESELVEKLKQSFSTYKLETKESNYYQKIHNRKKSKNYLQLMRNTISEIYNLNMKSILHKKKVAEKTSSEVISIMSIISFVSLVIIIFFVIRFPRYIVSPIVELTSKIKAISAKSFDQKIEFKSKDEIGSLTSAFNVMASRLMEYEEQHIDQLLFEKKRIESLVQGLNDGIILLDKEKKVILINSNALKILSLENLSVLNKNISILNKLSEKLNTISSQLLSNDKEIKQTEFYDHETDQYFNVDKIEIMHEKESSNKNEVKGIVIILKNVTLFKERDLAKTNLIATVSHELKTPISSVNLSLKLLNDFRLGTLNDDQKKLVESISLQNKKLLRVVNELLDYSQAETGKINLFIEQINPTQIVDLAASALMILLSEKEIELKLELMKNPPLIRADKEKSVWILVNILTNAIRYSPQKSQILIEMVRLDNFIKYSVIDHGSGISQVDIENIFKKFVKSDNKKGTGLGLSIAKEMVESQGGKIWVMSEINNGSQFYFTLPIA